MVEKKSAFAHIKPKLCALIVDVLIWLCCRHISNGLDLCIIRRVNFLLTSVSTPVAMHKLYLTLFYAVILQQGEF